MQLSLRDVWAAPPGVAEPAVRGVSLGLGSGDWLALGGPNGSGKTTLLLVAAGLLAPRNGLRELSGAALREDEGGGPRVATILQDPSVQLFAPTVAEEIGLTALHLGFSRERISCGVERWSAALGLEEDLARAPQSLSAGRQQLVLIAAALASEPALLVADEAGAHLDPDARARVLDALRRESARGLGVLWATQDPIERAAARQALELIREADGSSSLRPVVAGPQVPGNPLPLAPGVSEGEGSSLRMKITTVTSGDGPRVRTDRAFEVDLGARGITALTGPNGAGKTVLLMAACGLLDVPQVQVVRAAGATPPLFVGQYPERQIFEETVEREVTFAAVARGVDRIEAVRRATMAFERLDVGDLMSRRRRTWELSAGERRIVLLVGALTAPAGLLALDEPTAGLDLERRDRLARLVREAAATTPILVASQDRDWLAGLGCRSIPIPAP